MYKLHFFLLTVCTASQCIRIERKMLGAAGIDLRAQFGRKKRYLIKIAISDGKAKQKQ